MLRFGKTSLLAVCAVLLTFQGELKAQSAVDISTKDARSYLPGSGKTPTSAELKLRSVVAPSTKEIRIENPENLAAPTVSHRQKTDFIVDKLDLDLFALRATSTNEDCGPDKGKCSGTGHCCLIGGSGWCCNQDKKCGEDIGECK